MPLLLVAAGLSRAGRVRAEDTEVTTLPPVVVTAPRELDVQRAPTSAVALSQDQLEGSSIEGTGDLGLSVPNLVDHVSGDRKSPFVGMRGLSNTNMGDSSVGLYVDDVPYPDLRASLIELYDVERVEVLRGPQTTRFGRNAESGAISVYSPTPGEALHADASVRYGNYDTQQYRAAVSGPLVPGRAYFSFAGIESRRDGYIRNTFLHEELDDRDLLAGRGRLLFFPLPGFEIALIGEAEHADDGGQEYVILDQPDPFKVQYDEPGKERVESQLGALKLRYATHELVLTSITSGRAFDSPHHTIDLDFSPRPLLVAQDNHRFSDWNQEVRVASAPDADRWRRLQWHLGGYFEDRDANPEFITTVNNGGRLLNDTQSADLHTRTYAAFGESTLALTDALELTVGGRYERFRFAMDRRHETFAPPAVPPIHGVTRSNAWLPRAALAWHATPSLTPYVSASRGYRPGGFAHLTDDIDTARFRPEFGWTYETGVKSAWADGRLVANLSLYYTLISDYQDVHRVGLSGFTIRNARRSTSRGLDFDLLARPAAGLDITGGVGYIDAHYDDFRDPSTGQRFDGNRIALAPAYDFTFAVQYQHATGALARVEYQGVGEYPFLDDGLRSQAGFELLNARVGWHGERFGLYAFGRNLTDAIYYTFAAPLGITPGYFTTPGDPRTFGLMAEARF